MHKFKNILVVASHPDDEVLGCGGTLYNLKKKGAKISVLFLSDGESSRKHSKINKLILQRKKQAKELLFPFGKASEKSSCKYWKKKTDKLF